MAITAQSIKSFSYCRNCSSFLKAVVGSTRRMVIPGILLSSTTFDIQ
jgi:hypothetical protein